MLMNHRRVRYVSGLRGRMPLITVALVSALVLNACSAAAADVPFVDLTNREPVPAAAPTDSDPLRMAVAAVLSPEGNIDNYAGLARYLGDHLGRPVELVQRRTYAEVNDLVADGAVDLAFVCTSAYVAGSERGEMELLVVPEVGAERVYYSSVIVPSDSTATTFADLEGTAFAFTDPMSNTGRVYPTYLVKQLGDIPESFFASVFFTYSHDKAIEAVADGVADGAAVDSLVLDYALARDPSLGSRIRVIHRSPPFGMPPVVVPTVSAPELRDELQQALLELQQSSAGRAILDQIGVDRFVIGNDEDYESVRSLVAATGLEP
jgi:phosphonate transport system substrate-binding protein